MKYLFFFLIISLPILSQSNIEFCQYLSKQNKIQTLNFDSSKVKIMIDSFKNYVIQNKNPELPKICNKDTLFLPDLNDYMRCFTNHQLDIGTLLYHHFEYDDKINKEYIYLKFNQFILNNYNLDYLPYVKVYCDIFQFENETISTIYNPDDLIVQEIKEVTNNYFIFFIAYL